MKFRSSLREAMLFIKYSKDRENLNRILEANEKRFREVERRAADVIEAITNSGIKYDEKEEAVEKIANQKLTKSNSYLFHRLSAAAVTTPRQRASFCGPYVPFLKFFRKKLA